MAGQSEVVDGASAPQGGRMNSALIEIEGGGQVRPRQAPRGLEGA
jgi:hypothetical protein